MKLQKESEEKDSVDGLGRRISVNLQKESEEEDSVDGLSSCRQKESDQ